MVSTNGFDMEFPGLKVQAVSMHRAVGSFCLLLDPLKTIERRDKGYRATLSWEWIGSLRETEQRKWAISSSEASTRPVSKGPPAFET